MPPATGPGPARPAGEDAEHEWRVTSDASAAGTDTEAFLRELRRRAGAGGEPGGGRGDADGTAAADAPSFITSADGLKVILLGDSAVGKSKLVERFLMDGYQPQQLSTFALTLFRYNWQRAAEAGGAAPPAVPVDFWDTAGQERFNNLHPSYFYRAHAGVLVFDVTRKLSYKNLDRWYEELLEHSGPVPCVVLANKIDIDYKVTGKSFAFASRRGLPLFFVSAADGTNVVKAFTAALSAAQNFRDHPPADDYLTDVLELLADSSLGTAGLSAPAAK